MKDMFIDLISIILKLLYQSAKSINAGKIMLPAETLSLMAVSNISKKPFAFCINIKYIT